MSTAETLNYAEDEVSVGVFKLRRTFESGVTKSAEWRIQQLAGLERFLEEREDDIAKALEADLGRSAYYSWLADVAGTKAEATYARKHVKKWMRRQTVGVPRSLFGGKASYTYEPVGVVLIIGPWNYPVYLTVSPMVAALAAGNVIALKPSEHAPATSRMLAELLPQYIDPSAIHVFEGDAAVTQSLLAAGMDHAFFTGGTEIGRAVMAAAAPTLTPVTLELGGKSPVIVSKNAEIEVAARRVAWIKLLNSGQTCVAPDYVLVDKAVRPAFVTAVLEAMKAFQVDEPATQRLVSDRQLLRLQECLVEAGGEIVVGGGSDTDAVGMEPTVVLDPRRDSRLMTEEIFGPILPIVTVDGLDEAIEFVNGLPHPLGIYLFSKDKSEHGRVMNETTSGAVVINHVAMHVSATQLPFGGVGDSGMGDYHGWFGFERLSQRRALLVMPTRPDPSFAYPPYSEKAQRWLRRLY